MSDNAIYKANPAPLGLLGFGMTTIFLNLYNTGILENRVSMILAIGLFYGGIAQVIAGLLEWKKGNTFGMTAFISYGFFWISLVALIVMPNMGMGIPPSDKISMAWFLGVWGVFSLFMFIGTLKANRTLQFVFGSLTLLFFGLAIGDATGIKDVTIVSGYIGLICGASAFYLAVAEILNEKFGNTLFPIDTAK
jgi:succinate-acetate transporter protein